MKTIAENIANQFNNNGTQFYLETHDDEIEIVEVCFEMCTSRDKEDNFNIYNFIDGSRILVTQGWWTNKEEEIEEFLNLKDSKEENLSMESLNLSWENFL